MSTNVVFATEKASDSTILTGGSSGVTDVRDSTDLREGKWLITSVVEDRLKTSIIPEHGHGGSQFADQHTLS